MTLAGRVDHDRGYPPDDHPRFVHRIALKWQRENREAGERPHAITPTRYRYSHAAKCARFLGYEAAGIEKSTPFDLASEWNTGLGRMIHEAFDEVIQEEFPGAQVEVVCGSAETDASGHADVLLVVDVPSPLGLRSRRIVIELKTSGGWAYKSFVGAQRKSDPPEGPRFDAICQGALAASDLNADELVVGVLSREAIAKGRNVDDLRRFCAEWTFTPDQFRPVADAERARVAEILHTVDDGLLPARLIPGVEGEIVDASNGRHVVADGNGVAKIKYAWHCGYCSHQRLCQDTPRGVIETALVVKLREQL